MSTVFDTASESNEAEGEALRDGALTHHRVHRSELIRQFTAVALRVALDSGEVCADDVRALVPIPLGISPTFVGCVFRDLADAGILRRDGYQNSKRPLAHARPISRWRLADRSAAELRLVVRSAIEAVSDSPARACEEKDTPEEGVSA